MHKSTIIYILDEEFNMNKSFYLKSGVNNLLFHQRAINKKTLMTLLYMYIYMPCSQIGELYI